MEEDIEIVKKFIKSSKPTKDREFYAIITTKTKMEAIENILNRLEQLEKENEELKHWKSEQGCSIQEVYELFIPKSVIREKIEEYLEFDKKYKTWTKDGRENFTLKYFKAEALKELLGEEK